MNEYGSVSIAHPVTDVVALKRVSVTLVKVSSARVELLQGVAPGSTPFLVTRPEIVCCGGTGTSSTRFDRFPPEHADMAPQVNPIGQPAQTGAHTLATPPAPH